MKSRSRLYKRTVNNLKMTWHKSCSTRRCRRRRRGQRQPSRYNNKNCSRKKSRRRHCRRCQILLNQRPPLTPPRWLISMPLRRQLWFKKIPKRMWTMTVCKISWSVKDSRMLSNFSTSEACSARTTLRRRVKRWSSAAPRIRHCASSSWITASAALKRTKRWSWSIKTRPAIRYRSSNPSESCAGSSTAWSHRIVSKTSSNAKPNWRCWWFGWRGRRCC